MSDIPKDLFPVVHTVFAPAMQRELVANTYKGSWTRYDLPRLKQEMEHHVLKLFQVMDSMAKDTADNVTSSQWMRNRVLEFAADVGNCALFCADNLGVLTEKDLAARINEKDMSENIDGQYQDFDPVPPIAIENIILPKDK